MHMQKSSNLSKSCVTYQRCQVLIVGLGPSGMMIANEMQKHRINYLIIDKRKAISDITRAVNLTPASLASLEFSLREGASILKKTTQTDSINAYWHGKLISRISYKYQEFPYKKFYYLPQPILENFLHKQLKFKELRILEETELTEIKKLQEGGYLVSLQSKDTVGSTTIECKYLIGCDGNNSFVRQWAKIPSEEEDYKSSFLLYDIETAETITVDSGYHIFEHGYIIIVPIFLHQYRIILSSSQFTNYESSNYEDVNFLYSFIKKYCAIEAKIKRIIWFTSSGFRHRIASSCYEQNHFLVGDAFHVFSPVGGLNMNAGLQDAINLGWKLAYTIKGYADERLLETYAAERMIAVQAIKDKTRHLTWVMTQAKTYGPSRRYVQSIPNRINLKQHLPKMLSGYDNYSEPNKYQGAIPFKVGHHVSEFIPEKSIYSSICSSLNKQKFNLLANGVYVVDQSCRSVLHAIKTHKINFNNHFLLLRPDGYIQRIDNASSICGLSNYLTNYLGG